LVPGLGARAEAMNPTSGARTVSGSRKSVKPVCAQQLSRSRQVKVPPEPAHDARDDAAVVVAAGFADDEDAADELGAFIGDVGVQEFVGGHERGGHVVEGRNVAPCVNGCATSSSRFYGYTTPGCLPRRVVVTRSRFDSRALKRGLGTLAF